MAQSSIRRKPLSARLWLDLSAHDGEPSAWSILSASSLQSEHLACWHPLQPTVQPTSLTGNRNCNSAPCRLRTAKCCVVNNNSQFRRLGQTCRDVSARSASSCSSCACCCLQRLWRGHGDNGDNGDCLLTCSSNSSHRYQHRLLQPSCTPMYLPSRCVASCSPRNAGGDGPAAYHRQRSATIVRFDFVNFGPAGETVGVKSGCSRRQAMHAYCLQQKFIQND